jgi:cell division protein DivIC
MLKNAIWLFVLALFIFFVFLPSYTKMQDLQQKNLDYQHQIELLQKKNLELGEEKRLLEDDPEYLEKVAREKMGLIKENEVVFKIVPVNQVEGTDQRP